MGIRVSWCLRSAAASWSISSFVLSGPKLPKKAAGGVIRISFGPESTKEEIDQLAAALRKHHDTRMPML